MKNEITGNIFSKEQKERNINKFWEHEEPIVFEFNRLQFRLYAHSGKLQIKKYNRYGAFGNITLDRRAITPEMVELFKEFINLEVEKETK